MATDTDDPSTSNGDAPSDVDDVAAAGTPDTAGDDRVRAFDFRRPARLGPDRMRSLGLIHDAMALQLSAVLSSTLRTVATVTHEGVTETTFGSFVGELPSPTQLCVATLPPLPGAALLHVPISGALLFVDLMLGGRGRGVPDRALTDLELALVSPMLRRGIGEFATAWRPHIELRPELAAMESDPDFVRIAAPSDAVIVNRFRLELTTPHPTDPTTLTICYPYSMLQPVLESTDGSTIGASGSTPQVRAQVAERLAQSPIQLSVQFEPKRLSGLEILNLRPGDVLALPHSSEAPLTVFAGEVPVLEVQPTRKGSRVAARVTRMIGDPSNLRSRDLAGATSTTRREGGR